jgi:hypothetical protein
MSERQSLEGRAPEIADGETLAELVELAFDYRGDVTIATRDGVRRVGYVFNRRRDVAHPFIQIFPAAGGDPETITYAEIEGIAFTGRDTAAGNTYAAWLKRKQAARAGAEGPSGGTPPSRA